MARRETEVMSLEWHLEQRETRDAHLTHHSMDSERIVLMKTYGLVLYSVSAFTAGGKGKNLCFKECTY